MGAIKQFRRRSGAQRVDLQARVEGAGDRINHLLERIAGLEEAVLWLYLPKCQCGSRETNPSVWVIPLPSTIISANPQHLLHLGNVDGIDACLQPLRCYQVGLISRSEVRLLRLSHLLDGIKKALDGG